MTETKVARVATSRKYWIVRRDAEGQRIPVSGPYTNTQDLNWAMSNARFRSGCEVQTMVYDQLGYIIPGADATTELHV